MAAWVVRVFVIVEVIRRRRRTRSYCAMVGGVRV